MLLVENVTVRFGSTVGLAGVSLSVAHGEVVCLLGPSGSGKSTLLRVVAGIECPASGRVLVDGNEVSGPGVFIEPEHRRVGMVFQDYALFPHLTVAQNVAFGLPRGNSVVQHLLARLGLGKLADSYPHQLSGGESQRVALARAMAPKPRVLLMDEPFSSLDSRLRDDVRRHTLDFVRESQTTTVIVTHDPDEAMRIGDRIALLDAGGLVQFGSPAELYSHPATLFAARFFSDVAALPGTCGHGRIETSVGGFPAPGFPSGSEAIACVRPHHFRLAPHPTAIAARVVSSEFCGDTRHVLVKIDCLESPVAIRAPQGDASAIAQPGMRIYLEVNTKDVPVVSGEPGVPADPAVSTSQLDQLDKEPSHAQQNCK